MPYTWLFLAREPANAQTSACNHRPLQHVDFKKKRKIVSLLKLPIKTANKLAK